MKKDKIFQFLAVALTLLSAPITAKSAFAAFNISVVPYEGGNDLRFGVVNNFGPYVSKQMIVNITSDLGKQYQLVQTLLEPFTNDQGVSLAQNNFTVYGIRGSNKFGTLGVEQELPVSLSRKIIYTSSQQGASDSFNLIYVLKHPFNAPSGNYHSRIAFTLEPIGFTLEPVTVVINIFAQISVESGFEIKTITGSSSIALSSSRQDTLSSGVLIESKGDMGSQFKIFQSVSEPLMSIEGEKLPFEAINFQVSEAKHGNAVVKSTPLSGRREEIYSSEQKGQADSFVVSYSLVEPEKQKAGKYKSHIRYTVENVDAQTLLRDFELEAEIARIFDLMITPELGGRIEFRDLKPQQPPKQSEILIEVNSNTGKQYQVNQQTFSGLLNKEGKVIPAKYFTLKEESLGTKGALLFTSPVEVKTGEMILFVSDKNGSSDKFKVTYTLMPSLEIPAGDYSTRMMYSISEI